MRVSDKELSRILQQDGYEATDGYYDDGNGRAIVTPEPKQHKYRAQATTVDGIRFDSKAEAERYVTLKAMELAGDIVSLRTQPQFILLDGFTDSFGTKHRAVTYKADFSYWVDDKRIVEDVKGIQTPVFRLKHKLLMQRYCVGSSPQFEFRIVDKRGNTK